MSVLTEQLLAMYPCEPVGTWGKAAAKEIDRLTRERDALANERFICDQLCEQLEKERDAARAIVDRLLKEVDFAIHKLTCVELERGCSGVPEIVRVCDRQATIILHEAAEQARKP